MRKIIRETGISNWSVRWVAKQELGLKPYKIYKLSPWRMKTSVYGCNDVVSSFRRPQVSIVSGLSSRMRSCFTWNKRTATKRAGAVHRGSLHLGHHGMLLKSADGHGMGRKLVIRKTPLAFLIREAGGQNLQGLVPTPHAQALKTSIDPAALRWCGMDVEAGFYYGSQEKDESGVGQSPLSGFHHIFVMAAVLFGSESTEYGRYSANGIENGTTAFDKFGRPEPVLSSRRVWSR